MIKEDLIGKVVISKAGRDNGKYFIIMDVVDENYVMIADGKLRPESKPKKKKLRHLGFTDIIAKDIKEELLAENQISNSTIRKYLQLNDFDKEV